MKAVIMVGRGYTAAPADMHHAQADGSVVNKPMMEHILDLLKKHDF